jgi:hypothetical protein
MNREASRIHYEDDGDIKRSKAALLLSYEGLAANTSVMPEALAEANHVRLLKTCRNHLELDNFGWADNLM